MRSLKLVLGICLMAVFLICCATTESNVVEAIILPSTYFSGPVDIIEVMNTWNVAPNMSSIGGVPMYGFTNPDLQEDIQYVIVLIFQNIPIAYTYLLDGEPYVYFMNEETGIYEIMLKVDKEQWKLNFQNMFSLEVV